MARKTVTSTEVKTRWINANYKRYNVNLRLDNDKELIEHVESEKAKGLNTSEIFKEALQAKIEAEK